MITNFENLLGMSDHDTVFLEFKGILLKYWNKNQGRYLCARKRIGTALNMK
jgi:hypothetical protein